MILRGPRVHCHFPAGPPSLRPPRGTAPCCAAARPWLSGGPTSISSGGRSGSGNQRIDGRLLVTEPETAKSKRFVPISVQTERLLRDLRDARPRSAWASARPGRRAATCSPPSSANPATRATPCGPSRQRPPGPGSRRGPAPAPALGGQRDAHAWRPAQGGLRDPRPPIGRDHPTPTSTWRPTQPVGTEGLGREIGRAAEDGGPLGAGLDVQRQWEPAFR